MLNKLKSLLKSRGGKEPGQKHELSLAVATVMAEVMRIDGKQQDSERNAICKLVQRRFDLPEKEALGLVEEASRKVGNTHDLHQFTSQIIKSYTPDERITIVRELWQIAMADGHIDPHEEHIIRRLADLIGVYHREFIEAKIAAREKED